MWCIPNLDDEYVRRMEDVLKIYAKPYDATEPVICLDEKPLVLHAEIRPFKSAKPGSLKKRDSEYKRMGTANLFMAVLPKAGLRHIQVTQHRTSKDFAEFLKQVADKYCAAKKIHLIMDNLNTHKEKSLIERYGEEKGSEIWRRFKVHYTPVHGSWLNMAELELSVMSRQAIGKSRFSNIDLISKQLSAWNKARNKIKAKIDWTFTAKDARKIFKYEPVKVL